MLGRRALQRERLQEYSSVKKSQMAIPRNVRFGKFSLVFILHFFAKPLTCNKPNYSYFTRNLMKWFNEDLTLTPFVLVRIQVPQPNFLTLKMMPACGRLCRVSA